MVCAQVRRLKPAVCAQANFFFSAKPGLGGLWIQTAGMTACHFTMVLAAAQLLTNFVLG